MESSLLNSFALFEMTPDLVCIAGKDGFFKNVNPAVIDKLGYLPEELFAKPIASFIHPEDKDLTSAERANLLEGNKLLNFQNRYLTKTGQVIWLEWTSIYLSDMEVVFAIAKDITARKLIENEVEEQYKKFKNLATHFKTSIEKDKKYLAAELHEELAQLASAVRVDIDWLYTNIPGLAGPSKNRIEHALAVSDLLVDTIRRISFSISPSMLDDLGLEATLEWYAREFSVRHGISCRLESAFDESDLTREVKLDFFRICQEAMANVQQHAGATRIEINIEEVNGNILLTIADNGNGFDPSRQKKISGLRAMQERTVSINGQFTIQSEPGTGTKVRISVPK